MCKEKIEVFIVEILCLDSQTARSKPGTGRVIDPRGARAATDTCGSLTVLLLSQGITVVVFGVRVEHQTASQPVSF